MNGMLKGKVALITGAGRGIGKSAALLFAAQGASVVVSDLDAAPAEETVAEITAAGGRAISVAGDVTADGFPERLVETAVGEYGPSIDILVNNAGYTWDALLHKMSDEQWEAMLKVHVTAPFRLIRAATSCIRDAGKRDCEEGRRVHRKIINVSSIAGTDGNPGQVNYSSGKAGVIGLTKTLAREWGRYNVNVNAVAYGWIETRLTQARDSTTHLEKGREKIAVGVPKEQLDAFRMMIPLGRPGTPTEAAGVMLFLASPLSDYVSGQVLKVTGGW